MGMGISSQGKSTPCHFGLLPAAAMADAKGKVEFDFAVTGQQAAYDCCLAWKVLKRL